MKNSVVFLLACLIGFSSSLISQTLLAPLSEDDIQAIQASFEKNANNTALINAITHNDLKKLAVNRENDGKLNHYFSNKVDTKGISNQNKSGRCWLYTGLNTLKPMVQEKYKLNEFEFSQTYNFFWDQFEKANLFLTIAAATANKPMDDREVEWLFKNPIGDGGQWTTFSDNVKKYGLVPTSAMPDTYQSKNTRAMSSLLARLLREQGLEIRALALNKMNDKAKKESKMKMLQEVYRLLVLTLGEVPSEFTWQYENIDGEVSPPLTFTPKEFYNELIGIDLDEYVMLMNDPSKEYYKLYEVEYDRNLVEGSNWKFVNLPADKIKEFAKASILEDEAMYFSCDVGKQLDVKNGTLDLNNYDYNNLMGINFSMDKKSRIKTFDSGSTHGMALIGVNILEDGSVDKWLLENSWGADKGHKGYLTMTDEWFEEFMFRLVVHSRFIDAKTKKVLGSKAIMLPPWDPVFASEE